MGSNAFKQIDLVSLCLWMRFTPVSRSSQKPLSILNSARWPRFSQACITLYRLRHGVKWTFFTCVVMAFHLGALYKSQKKKKRIDISKHFMIKFELDLCWRHYPTHAHPLPPIFNIARNTESDFGDCVKWTNFFLVSFAVFCVFARSNRNLPHHRHIPHLQHRNSIVWCIQQPIRIYSTRTLSTSVLPVPTCIRICVRFVFYPPHLRAPAVVDA